MTRRKGDGLTRGSSAGTDWLRGEEVIVAKRRFPKKFRPVCQYVMRNKRPQDLKILDQKLWQTSGVVYARTYRNKVIYIGSTDHRLSTRIRAHLKRSALASKYQDWAEGRKIVIVAYKPAPHRLFRIKLYMHRAIEPALIAEFGRPGDPDWFGRRR